MSRGARGFVARSWLAGLTLVLLAAGSSLAHVTIRNSAGKAVHWAPSDRPVRWVMNDAGSDDILDESEHLAVQRAAAGWNDTLGADIELLEVSTPGQRARTDWQANDLHLVLFDEANDSGFFGGNSSLIAVTNLQFSQGSGRILDADLLFNGAQPFATDLSAGAFDVRGVASHELGHLLGLDHSAVVGATMAPFTSLARFEPRSLHADDRAGLRATYPAALPGTGRLEGRVQRGGVDLAGAQVWARATDGRVLAATLTDSSGRYELDGLPPEALRAVAAPLDGPILPGFLSNLAGLAYNTSFAPVQSDAFMLTDGGTLMLDLEAPADVALRVLEPLTVRTLQQGSTSTVHVRVVGYSPAPAAGVSIPDAGPELSVGDVQFTALPQAEGDLISVPITVSDDAPAGLYDLRLHTAGGAVTLVCGYLEVVPPPPAIDMVLPPCSGDQADTELLFFGTNVPVGSEVALGDTLIGPATDASEGGAILAVTLPALAPGLRDLVVVVPSGQEARVPGAHLAVTGAQPQIDFVFPRVAQLAGGTLVTVIGSGFGPEQVIELGGEQITPIFAGDPQQMQFVTPAYEGIVTDNVVVRNTACDEMFAVSPQTFEIVSQPDMQLHALQPTVLPASEGGEAVVVAENYAGTFLRVLLGFDSTTSSSFADLPLEFAEPDTIFVTVPPGPVGGYDALLASGSFEFTAALADALYLAPLIDSKDQLVGGIDTPGSTDSILLDGLAGTRVTLTLKRTGKNNTLQPGLRVLRDDGSVLLSSVEGEPEFDAQLSKNGAKQTRIAKLELPATERYTVELLGVGGSTGSYRLTLKELLPKSAKSLKLPKQGAPAPGVEPVELALSAKAGSLLSGKLSAKGDLVLAGVELESPSGALLLSTDELGVLQADADVLARVILDAEGRFLRFKKLALPEFGSWTLRLFAEPDTSGPLGGKLTLKAPKGKTVFTEGEG
ncbi:MAG: hypothetical protein DHS20C15_33870 [Planctomycetota bacterium]|nr:MAG: hypothetical protein DHS20C15_33870 [Planctomycetota bacterium]